jgi:hypothetical protein
MYKMSGNIPSPAGGGSCTILWMFLLLLMLVGAGYGMTKILQ